MSKGLWPLIALVGWLNAQKSPAVCARPDAVGQLIREWSRLGQAAGNTGDFYDNRDGGHSTMSLAWYPQLTPLPYTNVEIKAGLNRGYASRVIPKVVIGNASLAAPALSAGSLPRMYYTASQGPVFLSTQFRAGNLYVYPEHQDHDPGENGMPGYVGSLSAQHHAPPHLSGFLRFRPHFCGFHRGRTGVLPTGGQNRGD